MIIFRSALFLGLAFLLPGCQTPGSDPLASATIDKSGTASAPPTPRAYPIASSAGVDGLVGAALRHHPSLLATRARVTALEQSAIQARALPDPSASLGTGRMAETAAGKVVGTVGLQQVIPFPGKRSASSLAILRQADAMRSQLKVNELALAERVRTAYWNYYAASRTVAVVTEARNPLTTLRESVEARVATNKASQQDLLRLGNELTRLDQRLATARGRSEAARSSLNALLYRPGGSPLPAPRAGSLEQYGPTSVLLARANASHPEVTAAQARVAAAEQGVQLARLKKRPDLMAGVSYSPVADDGIARSATGKDQFMGTLGITLPLWKDKNVAAEREAGANLSAEQSTLASTRSSLQQRIESAAASYQAERATLALYADKLLPDARQSFDLTVTGYQSDNATFLDVIDAWRQLLTYRLEHEENRARLGVAEATLRAAAGLP